MSQSDLEKTEQPTEKRIKKSREEGNVPRSKELTTCLSLLAAGLGLIVFGSGINETLKMNLHAGLTLNRELAYDPFLLLSKISASIEDIIFAFIPLAALLFLITIASPVFIGGWNLSVKSLGFKASRLNPLSGIKNIISKNSLIELVKSILKATLVGGIGYMVVSSEIEEMMSLISSPLEAGIAHTAELFIKGFMMIVSSLILIAVIDVPFQLYQYKSKLKMSKQEVREEAKESDGNPEIKAKIRQQQREMARNRMMSEIPNADVVITNPTHYSVAIKYSETTMGAPVVVAKGVDEVARRIREAAAEHQIITMESPKLARALYANTEIGDQIPEVLYGAVAEILAYVFQVQAFHAQGGTYPKEPSSPEVPDEMDPHLAVKAESL